MYLTEGESKRVPQLHSDHIEEYRNLTDEQKVELVENFKNIKARAAVLRRATPRAKIQDVANIVRNIQLLVCRPLFVLYTCINLGLSAGWPQNTCRCGSFFLYRAEQHGVPHGASMVLYFT
jgi:hypothetical protein